MNRLSIRSADPAFEPSLADPDKVPQECAERAAGAFASAEAAYSCLQDDSALQKWLASQHSATAGAAASKMAGEVEVVVKSGPAGLGIELDSSNRVSRLVPGGQAAHDGVLRVGDQLLAVDGERLRDRPLVKVLQRGKLSHKFTLAGRDASQPSGHRQRKDAIDKASWVDPTKVRCIGHACTSVFVTKAPCVCSSRCHAHAMHMPCIYRGHTWVD